MDLSDAGLALCRTVLLVWTVVFCLLVAGRKFMKKDKATSVPATFHAIGEAWQWWFHASPDDDRVAQQMDERRMQRMRVVVIVALFVSSANGIITVCSLATGEERWYTFCMDIVSASVNLITIVFNVQPALLSGMPKLFYSIWMAWMALHVSPAVETIDPLFIDVLVSIRIVLSMAILDMRVIILWNVVYGLAAWCQFVNPWMELQGGGVRSGELAAAMKEAVSCSLIVAICYSYKQVLASEIRERSGATASKRECGAVSSLLRAMADVVVKLDRNLRVIGDSPGLATLLLRESVRNADFESLLYSDEDKLQFHDCIDSTAENGPEVCVPWRFRLRDGVGSCVAAECFHTVLEDITGKIFHMLGVRELPAEGEEQTEGAKEWDSTPASTQQSLTPAAVAPAAVVPVSPAQPMPSEMFLELILQESCGYTGYKFGAATGNGCRAASGSAGLSLSSRSRGSSRSSRSSQSSRSSGSSKSSRSRHSSRSSGARRSSSVRQRNRGPSRGSIANLHKPDNATQDVSGAPPAICVSIEM